ncbi:MAG: hypothetical protein WC869_09095 [Phycisphaerae bacterium]|jgi:hypothetical protein
MSNEEKDPLDEPIALAGGDEEDPLSLPPPRAPGAPGQPAQAAQPINGVRAAAPAPASAVRSAFAPGAAPSAVRAIKTTLDTGKRTQFKRAPVNTGQGAVRCRLFHCKVAESSMEHLEDQINTWLDDGDIDVKHVGHMVGTMEGKHAEPNIIVMVWY